MSISSYFEKITGLELQRRNRRLNTYTDIVVAIAKEQPPSPVEVESILDEVGKTVEELRTDVDKHRRRLELKSLLATVPVIDRELAEIDRQLSEEGKRLEQAESRHDEVTTPLCARKKELREKRLEASSASQKLFNTCEDPGLQEQLRQVGGELEELLNKNRELVSQISYLNTTADMERHRASNEATAESRDCRLERAEQLEKQAKSLEQQIKSNEKAQEELAKRLEAIEEQMRSW
jgi:chromosome segregation ATPase